METGNEEKVNTVKKVEKGNKVSKARKMERNMKNIIREILLGLRRKSDPAPFVFSSFTSATLPPFVTGFTLRTFFTLATFLTFLTVAAFAADYRAFKRDSKRSGAVTEQAYPALTLKWSYTTQGAIVSSPIVYRGAVYFANDAGDVYAMTADSLTAEVKWQYSTDGKIVSSPLADNGIIYVISQDGNLYAFDAETGAIKWTYNIGSADCSSPVIYNGNLYGATGHPNKYIYCFNLSTRIMNWTKPIGQYIYSSPAVYNGVVYVGANDGCLYALDAYSGEVKWFFPTAGGVFLATPCVSTDGTTVYFAGGNDDRKVHALLLNSDGEPKPGWALNDYGSAPALPTLVSSITEADGSIYFVSGITPAKLYSLNSSGVTNMTPVPLGNASATGIVSTPVVANGVIYAGSTEGKLYAVDINGDILETKTVEAPILSTPAVANGWVYVGSGETGDGTLYAYKAAKVSAITYPEDGATVSGQVALKGIIENAQFNKYTVDYSLGNSGAWVKAGESTTLPAANNLVSLITSGFPEGEYKLRLTVDDGTSLNSKAIIGFFINNVITVGAINAASGGTVTSPDGTEVIFDPGALTEDDTVTIDKPVVYANSAYPSNFTPTEVVRSFTLTKAANAVFKQKVTIKIPYADIEVEGKVEANLRIAVWDTAKLKWSIVNTSKVYKDENKVTATVSHFSIYRLFEFKPGVADLIGRDSVYAYPNPALGNDAVFKCYLGSDADITVYVYNIAGEIVAELTQSGLGGNGVEIPWNIKDYASGVYIFKLAAVSKLNGERKFVTKKIAVVH